MELDHVLIAVSDLQAAAPWVGGAHGPARGRRGAARPDGERRLAPRPGRRAAAWRLAGVEEAAAEPLLPFFVEWGPGTPLPGDAPATHPAGAVELASLRLEGDPDRVAAWLGDSSLPLDVRTGAPAVAAVVLAGSAGDIVVCDL